MHNLLFRERSPFPAGNVPNRGAVMGVRPTVFRKIWRESSETIAARMVSQSALAFSVMADRLWQLALFSLTYAAWL